MKTNALVSSFYLLYNFRPIMSFGSKHVAIFRNIYYLRNKKIVELNQLLLYILTHCGRVTQICVFNTVKLGTSASSP